MFEKLTNLKSVRSSNNAFGFYVAYLFLGMLLGALAGGFATIFEDSGDYSSSLIAGNIIVVPYVLAIGLKISIDKNLGLLYYALSIIGAILAVFGGCLLGLIPATYMSTRNIVDMK